MINPSGIERVGPKTGIGIGIETASGIGKENGTEKEIGRGSANARGRGNAIGTETGIGIECAKEKDCETGIVTVREIGTGIAIETVIGMFIAGNEVATEAGNSSFAIGIVLRIGIGTTECAETTATEPEIAIGTGSGIATEIGTETEARAARGITTGKCLESGTGTGTAIQTGMFDGEAAIGLLSDGREIATEIETVIGTGTGTDRRLRWIAPSGMTAHRTTISACPRTSITGISSLGTGRGIGRGLACMSPSLRGTVTGMRSRGNDPERRRFPLSMVCTRGPTPHRKTGVSLCRRLI